MLKDEPRVEEIVEKQPQGSQVRTSLDPRFIAGGGSAQSSGGLGLGTGTPARPSSGMLWTPDGTMTPAGAQNFNIQKPVYFQHDAGKIVVHLQQSQSMKDADTSGINQ